MTKTFKVKNYKAIEEVQITSGAGLVVLGGKNGQGKSSFLDGCRELVKFVGKRETPEPIRLGEKSAEVEIVDEDRGRRYVRTFSRAKSGTISSTVGVYALDGARYENGAQIIAEDMGAEMIDAAQFSMLSPRDQRDVLLRQVELPFDLDQLAGQKRTAEDERKLANADVKRLQGALATMPEPAKDLPETELSATDLLAQISEAQEQKRAAVDAERAVNEAGDRLAAVRAELAAAEAAYDEADKHAQTVTLPTVDVAALEAQVEGIESTNAAVRAAKQYDTTKADLAAAEKVAADKQTALDALEQKKRDALKAANFPDPLLTVDDEQVLYDGVPFSQVNSAKQIGVGFDIATLADRALKIGFIKNGDLLDDESLAEIEERAIARGYTVLVERGRSGDQGYIFNEGELV